MDLHPLEPQAVLEDIVSCNRKGLGLVHGSLDQAIQDTCAYWITKYADLRRVNPNVLAGDVRQNLMFYLQAAGFEPGTLQVTAGPNCSAVLSGPACARTRVRKHPRNLATGYLLAPTPYPSSTLFGEDYSVVPWSPYVLWQADLKTQTLNRAWLAAVSNINLPNKAEVYARVDLPPAVLPITNPLVTPSDETEDSGWPDWREEEGGGTPSPA